MRKYIILAASCLAFTSCTAEHRAAIETGWEAYTIIIPTEGDGK